MDNVEKVQAASLYGKVEATQTELPKFRVKQPVVEMVDIITAKQGKKTMIQAFVIRELGDDEAFVIMPDEFHKRYEPCD